MTKKLKKKVNRIVYSMLAIMTGIVTFLCLNAEVFVMPMNIEDLEKTGISETANLENDIKMVADEGIQTLADGDIIECESIVQGAKDNNLSDGNYTFRVMGADSNGNPEVKDYKVEIINYYDDVIYSLDNGQTAKTVSLGDSTTEYKMLIVKYHKNLTIGSGVTVTATNVSNLTYKKGMYLCVMGELVNNGTISMTARGTYNHAGENVYLWKNTDNTYEYVPANGANGLPAFQPYYSIGTSGNGRKGNNGTNRGAGSGGQGGMMINGLQGSASSWMGASTGGTSYAGGNGTGGLVRCNSSAVSTSYTQASSTTGGNGTAYDSGNATYYFAGGGAGTIGGSTGYCRIGSSGTQTKAEDGTGGLLILYANKMQNDGKIVSNGSAGAGGACYLPGNYRGAVGGRRIWPEDQ